MRSHRPGQVRAAAGPPLGLVWKPTCTCAEWYVEVRDVAFALNLAFVDHGPIPNFSLN